MSLISGCLLKPSFYISSVEKHEIYQRVSNYAEKYFSNNAAVSSIPAEVYMDGLDEQVVKQAVDGKINAFFEYVNRDTNKIEKVKIDFSELEKNITDFFDEFAKENNIKLNDEFTEQLDKTIKAAEKDIESFANVYMLDYIEKSGIHNKIRKVVPFIPYGTHALYAVAAIGFIMMIILNKKQIKSALYWLSTSGLVASIIMLIPCIVIKSSDYFSHLVVRNDYIYYAVTGLLNDTVNCFMKYQLVILGGSVLIMVAYIAFSLMSKKDEN